MAATDARPIPRRNVAYRVTFPILDADGDLVTGAAGLDSEVSKDAGTFADCTNEATEIATSSGMYYLDLTATEMDADTVAVIVKTSTTGAKTTPIVLYPEEVGDIRVDVEQYGGTAGTFSGGRPEVNATHWRGTALAAPATAGVPKVAIEAAGDFAQVAADKAWASATRTLTGFSFAVDLSAAAVSAIWDKLTSGITTANSIGKLLVDNINATISSRSTHTAADVWAVATRALTDKSGFDLSGAGIQAIWDRATSLLTTSGSIGKLLVDRGADIATILTRTDVATSTRLASASYTAPDNATITAIAGYVDTEVAAIKTNTDKLGTAMELDGAVYRFTTNALEQAPTGGGGGSAAAIWDEPIAGHLTPGSTGAKLNAAAAAAGSGSISYTYTVYQPDDTTPLADVDVAFCTDLAMTNVVANGKSDSFGVVQPKPNLDPGTYYIKRQKSGWNFADPDVELVS